MTFGTELWRLIKKKVGQECFAVAETPEQNYEMMEGIRVYAHDALLMVRQTFVCDTNQTFFLPCSMVLEKITKYIMGILCNTDVEIYVFCLDECVFPNGVVPVGRIEKTFTGKCRSAKPPKYPLKPLPEGRTKYFEDDLPMLGDMNAVFSVPRARQELYAYISAYFCSKRFFKCIPEGKQVILSGGLGLDLQPILPISVTSNDIDFITDVPIGKMAEGDLDVMRWILYFKGDAIVDSGDGDILVHALMQIRNIAHLDKNRRIYYRTERSRSAKDLIFQFQLSEDAQQLVGASSSSTSSSSSFSQVAGSRKRKQTESSSRKKQKTAWKPGDESKKVNQYVNITKMRKVIINSSVSTICCPIEDFVVALIMATGKHDFYYRKAAIFFVNEKTVFKSYLTWQHEIGPLVEVYQRVDHPTDEEPDRPHKHIYYVKRDSLHKFVKFAYYSAVVKEMKKKGKLGQGDLDSHTPIISIMKEGQELRKRVMKRKSFLDSLEKECGADALKLSKEQRLEAAGAMLAWFCHYSGNAPLIGVDLTPGTTLGEDGRPMYGFNSEGLDLNITDWGNYAGWTC